MSAQILRTHTPAELALSEAFKTAASSLPGGKAAVSLRNAAFATFSAAGLPHRRLEDWHYTDLRHAMREALPLAAALDAAAIAGVRARLAAEPMSGCRLVLVDGSFVADLSSPLPQGVAMRRLSDVLADVDIDTMALVAGPAKADVAMALNAAFMTDGVVLDVAPGTVVAEPINIISASGTQSPAARFTRSAVRIGAKAEVRVAEWAFDEPAVQRQAFNCLIVALADDATLRHTTFLPAGADTSVHFEGFVATLGARTKLDSVAALFGGGLVRRQIALTFAGADAKAELDGVALLRGRAHSDTTMFVEHLAPDCASRETFRYILAESATGVFQGKIHVAPAAQGTDGKMMSRALLLSDEATMNNKPELEIFADDVACGHGATCGGLSEDQLFYLQARGLPRAEAEALLLEGFAGDAADAIGDADLIARFRVEIARWLTARRSA